MSTLLFSIHDTHVVSDDSEPRLPACRELTPRQLALSKAVRHAKMQGLPLREIARQLGISRNTVREYARALTQPTNRPHNQGTARLSKLTAGHSDCQNRFPFKLAESLDNDRGHGQSTRLRFDQRCCNGTHWTAGTGTRGTWSQVLEFR